MTGRVNPGAWRFETESGPPFDLWASVESVKPAGTVWAGAVRAEVPVRGRLGALRQTDEALEEAPARIDQTAQRKGMPPREDPLRYARYVMLFTPVSTVFGYRGAGRLNWCSSGSNRGLRWAPGRNSMTRARRPGDTESGS